MNRQFLFQSRRRDKLGRIEFKQTLTHEKLKKRAQGCEFASDRRLLLLRRVERCQPFTDGDVIYRSDIRFSSLSGFRMGGREVVEKLLDVAPVVAQGVFANVAFVTEVFEKLG